MEKIKYPPSHRQQAVYNAWDYSDKNLLIEAVAGSGKTTVLLEVLSRCKDEALFLAFNKEIQLEIQTYINANNIETAKAMTLHALGFMAVRRKYSDVRVNNSKYYNMANLLKSYQSVIFNTMNNGDAFKMTQMLINMNKVSRMYLTDDVEEIIEAMVNMDKYIHESPYLEQLWEDFIELRDDSYETDDVEIDFVDMIYLPVRYGYNIPVKPKYIFIDEAQDLNMTQHLLIDMILKQGDVERWVSVGDRNQAIYGFAGAHTSSFDLFKEKNNVEEFPLDICYRLPKKVLAEANKVYDVMQGFKEHDGVVSTVYDASLVKDGAMVVCRNTSPLFEMYFKLVSANKQVYMKGEDIKNRIINFLKPMKFDTLVKLKSKVRAKINKLKKTKKPINKFQAYKLEENLECVDIMIKGGFIGETDKVDTLISKLKNIFIETDGAIKLCTIHKSKGLEEDVVYILDEFLIPSKWAKSKNQLIQEENLKYVARTRAKEELHYLNSIEDIKQQTLQENRVKETEG